MSGSLLLALLPFLLLVASASASGCHVGDRAALLDIYAHLGVSSWADPHVECCGWDSVYCNEQSSRVQSLQFRYSNISGTISPAIGDLTELETFTIDVCPNVAGAIPSSIAKLKKLYWLSLSANSLSGPVPGFLSQLTSLTYLDLSSNKLSGSIPPSLARLVNLDHIILLDNRLTGPIPDFTGFKGNILLGHNMLSGPIPRSIAGRSLVNLSYNRLSGDASFLFGSSSPATEIHLQHNQLKFDLTHVSFPLNLSQLVLNHNYIYGSIPAQINQVTSESGLNNFNVSYNLLCGRIPQGAVTKKFVASSYAHNKCLCGKPLAACKRKEFL